MQLGIKSINSAYDAQRLSQQSGKRIAARVLIAANRLTGIKDININPNVLYNANIIYEQKILPTDLVKYKGRIAAIKAAIKESLWMVTVENEIFAGEDNYSLSMYADMLEHNYFRWTPDLIKVSTSGATNVAVAALTKKYLFEQVSHEAAAAFVHMYGTVYSNSLEDALAELAYIKSRKLKHIYYNFHYNVTPENVDCLPAIIQALRYYTDGITGDNSRRIGCNELSFSVQDPELVTKALNYLQKDLSFVFLYSMTGNNDKGVPFTSDMEKAALQFAQ